MLEQVMIKSILLIFVIRENKFFLSVNCHPLFFWFVNCARGPPLPFVRPSYKKDVGGAVASWLVRSTPDRAVRVRALTLH